MINYVKYYSIRISYLMVLLLTIFSCTEIFEGDLEDDVFVVISPSQDLQTLDTQIHFFWEKLEDATSYHLRIVNPGFSNLQSLVLDSSIVGNSFQITLNPGEYEWRLQAKNAITKSNAVLGSISIDSTADLSLSYVNLLSPSDQIYTNQTTQTFQWEPMYNADVYQFKLSYYDTLINNNKMSVDLMYDGYYAWHVIGKNNMTQTQTQVSTRNFTLDTYSPTIPINQEPIDNEIISLTQGGDSLVELMWNGDISEPDIAPVKDIIQVSTSNVFQNQNIIYEENLPITTTAERSVQVKIGQPGTYYWRVKSEDLAGNTSDYTEVSSYIINFVL